jgi:hypothetical protein
MTRQFRLALVISAVLAMGAVPSAAFGLRSYDGSDYSEDYDAVHRVRICDNETDGNGAYAKFRPNGTTSDSRIDDANGSQAGCTGSAYFSRIYSHQACEDISLLPDHWGVRVYP